MHNQTQYNTFKHAYNMNVEERVKFKKKLPKGSLARIAEKSVLPSYTVRAYFSGRNVSKENELLILEAANTLVEEVNTINVKISKISKRISSR